MSCNSLCSQMSNNSPACGEFLETQGLNFGSMKDNLIYMDKVFSLNDGGSCPLSFQLSTATGLTYQFLTASANDCCGCNSCCPSPCSNFELGAGTTFNVTSSKVIVNSVAIAAASPLTAANVTANGFAADALTLENGQYVADFGTNLDNILRCKCIAQGSPSRAFFLVNDAGTWQLDLQIQLEGTVTNGSASCCFRVCFSTPAATPISPTGTSSFAVPNLSLPCSINGISPVVRFSFDGDGTVLNPVITAVTTDGATTLQLGGLLIFEPSIHVQVTRPTLFEVRASESQGECDQLSNCCGCENALELDCEGAFDKKCGCSCKDAEKPKPQANTSCQQDCCQCNGLNGYRW